MDARRPARYSRPERTGFQPPTTTMTDQPRVKQLRDGQTIQGVYLVRSAELRTTRNGDPFLSVELGDASGTIAGKVWDLSSALRDALKPRQAVWLQGSVTSFQNRLQVEVRAAQAVDLGPEELRALLPVSPHPVEVLEERFHGAMAQIQNPWLQRLRDAFLADPDFYQRFIVAPAASTYHHAHLHGLLEHVCSLLQAAWYLCKAYETQIDRDILFMLIFLHDHGKVWELDWEGTIAYTPRGELVGHIAMGLSSLDRKLERIEGFPPLLADQLRHGILAHHGELEYGSPVLPKTLEALIMHELDVIDSNVNALPREAADGRDPDGPDIQFPYSRRLRRKLLSLPLDDPAPRSNAGESRDHRGGQD